MDWFALGMILSLASVVGAEGFGVAMRTASRLHLSRGAFWWAASVSIMVMCTIVEAHRQYEPLQHVLYGLAAFCLVVPAVFTRDGVVARVLSVRPIVWLGLISYGIYLWQYKLLAVIHHKGIDPTGALPGLLLLMACGLTITVSVAAASYYLLERPILRLKYERLRLGLPQRRRRVSTGAVR